jgi:hypothetical protein
MNRSICSMSPLSGLEPSLACLLGTKAAGDEKRALRFRPSCVWQSTQDFTNAIPLRQRHVIKVQRARSRHPVFKG